MAAEAANPLLTALAALVLVAAVAAIVLQLVRRSGVAAAAAAIGLGRSVKPRNAVVLVGPQGAGKSALFATLAHGKFPAHATFTSMAVNTTPLALSTGSSVDTEALTTELIDCPGHPRLIADTHRQLALASGKMKKQTLAPPRVVLVAADAAALHHPPTRRDVAERLALAVRSVAGRAALAPRQSTGSHATPTLTGRVLVVATKADDPLAAPVSQVRALLTDELHALRVARAAGVGALNEDSDDDTVERVDGDVEEDEVDTEDDGQESAGGLRRRRGAGKTMAQQAQAIAKLSLTDLGIDVIAVAAKEGKGITELMAKLTEMLAATA